MSVVMDYLPLTVFLIGCGLLIRLALYDLKHMRLPNIYVYLFALCGLLFHAITAFFYLDEVEVILGGALAFILLYVIRLISSHLYKREALGFGDVKLLAAAGLWLGPLGFSYALTLGAFCVVIYGLLTALFIKIRTGIWHLRQLKVPAGPGFIIGILVMLVIQYGTALF